MGHLSEDNFLGGQMRLDLVRARQAVTTKVAEPLALDPVEAREGIVRIIAGQDGGGHQGDLDHAGGNDLRELHAASPSGAPGRCMPAASRATLGMPA